ncbi:MAG: hypothetical protein ACXWFC_14435 [Nitrososphaeraceae archaeon]
MILEIVGFIGAAVGLLGGYFIGIYSYTDIPIPVEQGVVNIDVNGLLAKYNLTNIKISGYVKTIEELRAINLDLTKQNEEFILSGVKIMEVVNDQKVEIDTLKNLATQFEAKMDSKNQMIDRMIEILDKEDYKKKLIDLID